MATTNSTPNSQVKQTVVYKYTISPDNTGWLTVAAGNERIALPEYTKVTMLREEKGRVYFQVMDGNVGVGKIASLKKENEKYLSKTSSTNQDITIEVTYGKIAADTTSANSYVKMQQWALLKYAGGTINITLNSMLPGYSALAPGDYKIMTPVTSHAPRVDPVTGVPSGASTEPYVILSRQSRRNPNDARGHDAWMPIALNDQPYDGRFLHVGHLSEGCVTIREEDLWEPLYKYLIKNRLPNSKGKFVAKLRIKK